MRFGCKTFIDLFLKTDKEICYHVGAKKHMTKSKLQFTARRDHCIMQFITLS